MPSVNHLDIIVREREGEGREEGREGLIVAEVLEQLQEFVSDIVVFYILLLKTECVAIVIEMIFTTALPPLSLQLVD